MNPVEVGTMYVENVHLTEDGCAVEIIDQTLLPGEKRFCSAAETIRHSAWCRFTAVGRAPSRYAASSRSRARKPSADFSGI